uniref:Uncharacterized protein LOC114342861 n=1 Tax=Diabrotica virgifera virgifera TaxID=50390 RepID=A0A6P7GHX0_DIAVI
MNSFAYLQKPNYKQFMCMSVISPSPMDGNNALALPSLGEGCVMSKVGKIKERSAVESSTSNSDSDDIVLSEMETSDEEKHDTLFSDMLTTPDYDTKILLFLNTYLLLFFSKYIILKYNVQLLDRIEFEIIGWRYCQQGLEISPKMTFF